MPALSHEELSALKASLSRLLAERCTLSDVRRVMDSREGYDAALWAELAAIGLPGLVIAEEYGGAGAGPVELELIMEGLHLGSPGPPLPAPGPGRRAAVRRAGLPPRPLPA